MRLSRLVSDLNISVAESGTIDLTQTVDVSAITREAVQAVRQRAVRRGLDLTIDADQAVFVLGDAGRLRQIVDNLLENACRYTDTPGRIAVRCERQANVCQLTVEDTPPCPGPRELPHLFERFYRVEASRSRAHGGSGLGLAICRSLVEAHGGTIRVKRSSLGGLCVVVELPTKASADG